MSKRGKVGREHLFIPDTQIKEGVPTEHIVAAANYAADRRPDVIIVAGDWYDMPSLSAWDSMAKKMLEKRYYLKSGTSRGDVEAGNDAMAAFLKALHKKRAYRPELHFLFGNHEDRITRRIQESPELGEAISLNHLHTPGFKRHDFLKPVIIDRIAYCHYFAVDSNGRVMGSKRGQASARAQVQNVGMSATSGHKQGLDIHVKECSGGRRRGLIAGSFYAHEEAYLTPQGQDHWRGCIYKHDVKNGDYDLMELSLGYLLRKWS